MDKKHIEHIAESMIGDIKNHAYIFYNEGWDEMVDTYTDDDIFNILCSNKITNIDCAIEFFHNRFNPIED